MVAPLWQLSVSSQHIVPPHTLALSTHGQKLDPESLYEPIKFEPIFGQQILILDPLYIGLFGPSWSELSPWVICGGRGSIGPVTNFFVMDRNVTT